MHEVRATILSEYIAELVRLAHEVGIQDITVSEVFINEPAERRHTVSVETSTPKARAFLDAILNSSSLASSPYSVTSRELRAVVSNEPLDQLTRPMCEPFPDVVQDLWQLSQITPSYGARAAAGAILLATGVIDNNPVSIVVAALFLPFLSQVLAVSFGIWSRDRKLVAHGLRALMLSILLALAGGAAVGFCQGGPILFESFKKPVLSFIISGLIGLTAGLSTADDTGRRYLIGVAAAVQLAVFPVWLGVITVLGWPSPGIICQHLESFLVSLVTISATAVASFAALQLRSKGGWKSAPRSGR